MDSCWENEHFLQHQRSNYLQEGHSRAVAGPTCSSSSSSSISSSSRGMQPQKAAEATTTSNRKHQQAELRSILCALRHPLESAPSFFRCPLRPRPSRTTNETKKSDKALSPNSRRPNRLGILSSSYLHNHQASSTVSAPQQRPRQGSTVNKTSQR